VKIIIETIPHLNQRYNTVGDWQWEDGGQTLHVKVSSMAYPSGSVYVNKELQEAAIGLHEVIEALQCRKDDVTEKQVDEFDKGPGGEEAEGLNMEPGDHWDSPYKRQHCLATGFERILCFAFGITWYEYEDLINELSNNYDKIKEEEENGKNT